MRLFQPLGQKIKITMGDPLQYLYEILKTKTGDSSFYAQKEISSLYGNLHSLSENERDRAFTLFDLLIPYYEAGFLIQRLSSEWMFAAGFCHGNREYVRVRPMDMPKIQSDQVLNMPAFEINERWHLALPDMDKESRALLFRPSDKYAYLLISQFPELILREMIENTQELLLKGFSL